MEETKVEVVTPAVTSADPIQAATTLVNEAPAEPTDKTLAGEAEGEAEAAEEAPKETVVPEKYEVKVPEGMEIDAVLLEGISPVLKKHSITQEALQEIVDVYAPHIQKQVEEKAKAATQEALDFHNEQKESWKKESMKFLGAKSKEELSNVARFINTFSANKEEATQLREMMEISGLGNYLPLLKTMINAGKRLKPDSVVEPNKQSTIDTKDNKVLYPSMG